MSNITDSGLAAAVVAGVKNTQFQPTAEAIPSKILLIGTGNPSTEAGNLTDTPIQIFSPEDVGNQTGFGYMLYRLALAANTGARGIETWMIQQPENVAAAQAVGEIDFTTAGVLAGTWHMYVSGVYTPVTITAGMTKEDITDAAVAKISAESDLPITAAKHATTFEVDITAKSGGTFGNDIVIDFNLEPGQTTPTGITSISITQPTAGAGLPDIQDALDSLGTGDGANEQHFTDVIHGYQQDSTTLNAIRDYVGAGNDKTGLWDEIVNRPFNAYTGDIVAGSAGLSALVALGDGRDEDRASSIVAVPDSPNHPSEIAAQAAGIVARIANARPEYNYLDQILIGVYPGDKGSDRWSSEWDNRDIAVKAGVSPTMVKNGAVVLQNVVTFYHPDNVPQTSNGYRSVRNIKVISNIANNIMANFEQERWKGTSIVSDTSRVANPTAKLKARDIGSVRNDLVALARAFEQNAWIYSADYTIEQLSAAGQITVRTGGDGFNSIFKIILSGEGNILNTQVQFDTSIAVYL